LGDAVAGDNGARLRLPYICAKLGQHVRLPRMITKTLIDFPFGTKLTSRIPPQREVAVIVRGRFHLRPGEPVRSVGAVIEQGPLTADRFADGDDERAGECLYPSDFAEFKGGTDVMLRGSCHVPRGRAVTECTATFAVGAWSKSLRVVGRRTWIERLTGTAMSEPAAFVRMPLAYANAFGGPRFPANPAGKGHEMLELPNVEDPRVPVRSQRDRPSPAGFGPINPAWPQRSAKVGTQYGESWRKTRAPFYAEDFDWSFFRAAPADQQLESYLRGDEDMLFENLHPDVPRFTARLPGLRVRAFLRTSEPLILEPPMRLDTLLADLDAGTVTLTWRGLAPVREDDLKDVRTLLLASEPLAEPPREARHYHKILEEFEADPLERDKRMPPEAKAAAAAAAAAGDAAKKSPVDALAALMAATTPPDVKGAGQRVMSDLRSGMAKMDAMKGDAANANATASSGAAAIAARLDDALARMKKMRDGLPASGAPPAEVAKVDTFLAQPQLAQMAKSKPEVEPGPGVDLSERDLAGRDLSGRDLSGANLRGARLMGARLARAKLTGANLREAVLAEADMEGADLTGANLTKATLVEARLRDAVLTGAVLDGALLAKADLSGACLERSRGERVVLIQAKLAAVRAQRAVLVEAVGLEADLEGADFRFSRLDRCSFFKAYAKGILLAGADVSGSSFMQAELTWADATELRGERSVWRGASLDQSDLRWSHLRYAFFDEASLRRTKLSAAELKGASFYRAALDDAELVKANLFGANLAKTSLTRTSFLGANLYSAKLLGAGGEDTAFGGANIERVVFNVS
jgi:uncharacterized protein YjbI with pentapeptide repeats